MKKFLRFLLVLVLLIVVVFVTAGLIAPKETNFERTIVINAPKEAVWEQAVKFKNWPNWSAWHKMDPNQEVTYAGTDGEPGSSYSWKGEKTGEGTMTNKSVEGTKMNYELAFEGVEKPSDGYIMAEDAGDGTTKVSWTFHSINDNFIWRAMGYLFMNKMLKGQFDEGLANMKAYVEEHKDEWTPANAELTVEEIQFPAKTYMGYKEHVTLNDWEEKFGAAMGKLQAAGVTFAGPPVSIIYSWDDAKMEGDVLIGAPVTEEKTVSGATTEKIATTRAYKASYVGDPAGTVKAHTALSNHIMAKNEKPAMMIEEYAVSGDTEKDKNKFVTNVYYLVK